jgi:hypothetical protein
MASALNSPGGDDGAVAGAVAAAVSETGAVSAIVTYEVFFFLAPVNVSLLFFADFEECRNELPELARTAEAR